VRSPLPHRRFFFQVVIDKAKGAAGAVLVSTRSRAELLPLAEALLRGEGCASNSCTVVAEGATATLMFDVLVNGRPVEVLWGSPLASLLQGKRPRRFTRLHRGRPAPVEMNFADPQAVRMPLMPGDAITF
jgi:hypothetical protein